MPLFKRLKVFLFPAVNIFLGLFLLSVFYIAGQSVVQTLPVARMSALKYLEPRPLDYFWNLSFRDGNINKSLMRYYADYYEHLLEAYPGVREAYGILGYCYHHLGEDDKAIVYLNKAIAYNPHFIWNYYNLAAININHSRYQDAFDLFQKARSLDIHESLLMELVSPVVYTPLLSAGGRDARQAVQRHLQMCSKVSGEFVQILNQMPTTKNLEQDLKKLKLELYAF